MTSPTIWTAGWRSTRRLNIHLTGCHHSCAQHYIGDIGLLGAKVATEPDGEETVEGYHVYLGGGYARTRRSAGNSAATFRQNRFRR